MARCSAPVSLGSAILILNDTGRVVGSVMVPIGVVIMCYALFMYMWRLRMLISKVHPIAARTSRIANISVETPPDQNLSSWLTG